jgi:type II secretory pathway pseudopilin PulG
MYIKSRGLSLLEVVIVLGIFTIISVGVTNLSIKAIQHQHGEQTLADQNVIFSNIQDDIRRDMRSAFAVWLSSNGSTGVPSTYNNYIVSQACGGADPNAQSLATRSNNTLNILREDRYTPGATPVLLVTPIQYRFYNNGTHDYLLRLVGTQVDLADDPENVWPKDTSATAYYGAYTAPTFGGSVTSVASPSKVYNPPGVQGEDSSLDGSFEITWGDEYNPPSGAASSNCSFFAKTVSINGLTLNAVGHADKYDQAFGKANLVAPKMTFDLNTSLKFF